MSAAAPVILQVRELCKSFTLHLRDSQTRDVLQGVSIDVAAGECVALAGASGQGKSTLVKCLYGNYGVGSGQILLTLADGSTIDLAQASAQQWLTLRRREIAYVSQFLRAVPRVSALDVVAERVLNAQPALGDEGLACNASACNTSASNASTFDAARNVARHRARALLARLNLPDSLWDLPPATFSGGEQQRVNIARGFVEPARLLLLDEPTASLDAVNRRVVVQLIEEAKKAGVAIVGIFHDEEVRAAVATRCIDLGDKR